MMLKVGNYGDEGVVEISDLLFTSKGALPGLVLVEWNIAGDAQGDVSACLSVSNFFLHYNSPQSNYSRIIEQNRVLNGVFADVKLRMIGRTMGRAFQVCTLPHISLLTVLIDHISESEALLEQNFRWPSALRRSPVSNLVVLLVQ